MAPSGQPDEGRPGGADTATLVGRVSGAMRDDIVSGVYPAGARLNIDALAQRFGISIIPVREALRGLATEGLVTPEANKGYRVRSATQADLEETYNLRSLLDPLAVWLAVPQMTEAHLEDLGRHLEGMHVAENDNNPSDYWRHHIEFHFGIYRHCGQSWLLRFIELLYANSDRYRPPDTSPPPQRYAEHLDVLAACRSGDGPAAARHMQVHLHRTYLMRTPQPPASPAVEAPEWPTFEWS